MAGSFGIFLEGGGLGGQSRTAWWGVFEGNGGASQRSEKAQCCIKSRDVGSKADESWEGHGSRGSRGPWSWEHQPRNWEPPDHMGTPHQLGGHKVTQSCEMR